MSVAEHIMAISRSFGIEAQVVGRVEKATAGTSAGSGVSASSGVSGISGAKVTISVDNQQFTYTK
jgi:hypothetical protein